MPEPAGTPGTPHRWLPFLALMGVGGAAAALALLPIEGECGFRFLVGASCPGCGMTRASVALLRGDPGEAWRLHPAVFPFALVGAAALGLALHEGVTGRPTFRRTADRWGLPTMFTLFGILGAVWAARVLWRPEWSPDPTVPGSPAARILGK